jgi:hypothetical protein
MPAYSWREGFFPGGGFDSLRGDPKQKSVTGTIVPPENAAGQKGGTSFLRIDNSEEFDEAISVGVEIDVGIGLFGGGASFDYKKQCKVSSEATFVMVRVVAINPYERLAEPKLDQDAWDLLANNNSKRFRERFGDKWVSGQTTGVTFFGTVRIEASSREQQESIAAEVEASYGFFNSGEANVNFSSTMKSSDHRIEIIVQQNGGRIQLCDSVAGMFDSARQALLDARDGHGAPFAVQVEDYSELRLPNDDASGLDVEFARRTLEGLLRHLQTLETQANDISFVFQHKEWFEPFNAEPLNEAAAEIAEQMNAIRDAADVCSRDFKQCKAVVPEYPEFSLPARKAETIQNKPAPSPAPPYHGKPIRLRDLKYIRIADHPAISQAVLRNITRIGGS